MLPSATDHSSWAESVSRVFHSRWIAANARLYCRVPPPHAKKPQQVSEEGVDSPLACRGVRRHCRYGKSTRETQHHLHPRKKKKKWRQRRPPPQQKKKKTQSVERYLEFHEGARAAHPHPARLHRQRKDDAHPQKMTPMNAKKKTRWRKTRKKEWRRERRKHGALAHGHSFLLHSLPHHQQNEDDDDDDVHPVVVVVVEAVVLPSPFSFPFSFPPFRSGPPRGWWSSLHSHSPSRFDPLPMDGRAFLEDLVVHARGRDTSPTTCVADVAAPAAHPDA